MALSTTVPSADPDAVREGREPAYRFLHNLMLPLPGGRSLVTLPVTGSARVCGESEMRILNALNTFRTVDEHVESLVRQFPALRYAARSDLRGRIEKLRDSGALICLGEILARCSSAAPGTALQPVSWIALPTRDRVGMLSRALSSYLGNAREFSRHYRFFVADESGKDAVAAELSRLPAHLGGVVYAGGSEKGCFADRLIERSGAPPEFVRALLAGFGDGAITPGANRNAILLQTAGSIFLSVDDDTVCRIAKPGPYAGRVSVLGHGDPQGFYPFKDRASAIGSLRFESRDWVADHEQVLGHSPSSVLARFVTSGVLPDLDEACPHMFEMLTAGSGQIVMSLGGAVGDSGFDPAASLLVHSDSETRRRLGADSTEGFHEMLNSREVVRGARSLAISHSGGCCQTMFAGFDNRDILPPFFPAYRNEDGIFGLLAGLCVKGISFAHLPLVMQHLPLERRVYSADGFGKLRVSDWVMAACSFWSPGPAMDSRRRIQSLGWHLEALGSLPEGEFRATLMPPLFARMGAIIAKAENALKAQDRKPGHWAREVNSLTERYITAALQPGYLTATDIDAARVARPLDHLRMMIRTYGQILTWWPAIVQAASELVASGKGMGREIAGAGR